MKMKRYAPILLCFLALFFLVQSVGAVNVVVVDFYYSVRCGSCTEIYVPIINQVEEHFMENYSGKVIINRKEVSDNTTNSNEMRARGLSFPSVIINNKTKIPKANLTYGFLVTMIDAYLKNLSITSLDENIIYIPFIGKVNLTSLSIPVLTIMLGALDSFNPCSFFILIFLLNLLIHLQSRRRMLLVGGIFVFFSGCIYFIFMITMLNSFYLTQEIIAKSTIPMVTNVAMIAGIICLNIGVFLSLIFLLYRSQHNKTMKKIRLVGIIFIGFSFLFYAIYVLVSIGYIVRPLDIISLVAGVIALTLGVFNIKDFFFFKKGPSLSISDDKRKETFKRMRKLVKSPSLLAMLGGTIVLAVTVNFYELVCTFEFPFIFTKQLTEYHHLPLVQQYTYIFFYNIVYVIPLIIIVLLFSFTLGSTKLSEWHGRQLKLLSGIMIFSFGMFFIIDYKLLENVMTPIALLGLSVLLTIIISYLWKKYKEKREEKPDEEQPSEEKV